MNIVPRRNTPIAAAAAAAAVRRAYVQTFGREPSRTAFPLLMALVWIETGRGKSVQNHNFGNITAGKSWPGDAWRPPWFDFDGGTAITERNTHLHEEMLKGRAPSAFRAYDTPEAGALDFVRTLRTSFPEVLEAAELGEPDGFRVALSRKYSGDYKNPKSTPTLAQLQAEFQPFAADLPGDVPGDLPKGVGFVRILLIVGMISTSGVLLWQALRPPKPAKKPTAQAEPTAQAA